MTTLGKSARASHIRAEERKVELKKLLVRLPGATVFELATRLGVSRGVVQGHLKDMRDDGDATSTWSDGVNRWSAS